MIDFFIKLHNLFNYEYGEEFKRLMAFFEYAVYGFASSKRLLTAGNLELANEVMKETHPYPEAAEEVLIFFHLEIHFLNV